MKLLPEYSPPKVPIPVVLPTDKNGDCCTKISLVSCTNIIWWRALVDPTLTSTKDLTALKSFLLSDITVDADETVDE